MAKGFILRGELNVEFRSSTVYTQQAKNWFSGCLTVFEKEIQEILDGPALDPGTIRGGVTCGAPGALWGFCQVTTRGARGLQATTKVISEANLAWFLTVLDKGAFSASVGISRIGENGSPEIRLARITAEREEDADSWVRLGCEFPQESIADKEFQDHFLRFLKGSAAGLNPSFGHVAYNYTVGKTALEEVLGPPWLLPEDTLPESRLYLRGYSWLTVCPQELADRLGGAAELRATGAFHEVDELAEGGVWLLATPAFDEYDQEHSARVWGALAPVIRPGKPRQFSEEPGHPPLPVVYEDAAQARGVAEPE
ncbi:hypothetical protein SUDANB21_04416 [Streptomyces sp. enrichment culture]|uniref:hypothetical protein n=1 Tax=Streptomyces sp. enrichment culture TaxID=1795815 RepID=UPI003470E20B